METELVVIGGGPGGYAAAFRAKDLGIETVLIEEADLGGVCLNVGCIPSKTLLSVAEKLHDMKGMEAFGIKAESVIDVDKLGKKKQEIVNNLSKGIGMLAKKRKVEVVKGRAVFKDANTVVVGKKTIGFKHAIVAVGSSPNRLPFLPEDKRIFDSTGALMLSDVSGHLVVIGGGIIGCEMATIYQALGAKVTILEVTDQLMMGAEPTHAKICIAEMEKRGIEIQTGVNITKVTAGKKIKVETDKGSLSCDQILYSVGRSPNTQDLGIESADIAVDEKGFILVDDYMRTNQSHIYAIGDVAKTEHDNQMLAHRATAHGHIAAEIIAGHNIRYDIKVIPAVAYTDPEIAWVGISEAEAKKRGCKVGRFPWMASGRSLAMGQGVGETKVYADPDNDRIVGASIVGRHAGELIGVFCLSIEMGATLTDLALTVMPHPTLVETTMLSAEAALGTITDL